MMALVALTPECFAISSALGKFVIMIVVVALLFSFATLELSSLWDVVRGL